MNLSRSNALSNILSTKKLVLTAFMSAFMCILSPLSISLPLTPVPISLGLFAVLICSYLLEPFSAFFCILIYIALGSLGLPVFSGFNGGISRLIGPTGGFLIGFLFTVLISSFFIHKFKANYFIQFTAMILSIIPCYIFGSLWFSFQQRVALGMAVKTCVLPFILIDFIKVIMALISGNLLIKYLNKSGILV